MNRIIGLITAIALVSACVFAGFDDGQSTTSIDSSVNQAVADVTAAYQSGDISVSNACLNLNGANTPSANINWNNKDLTNINTVGSTEILINGTSITNTTTSFDSSAITNAVNDLGNINGAYSWDASVIYVSEAVMTAASTVTVSSLPVGKSASIDLYCNGSTNISIVGGVPLSGGQYPDAGVTNSLVVFQGASTLWYTIGVPQ